MQLIAESSADTKKIRCNFCTDAIRRYFTDESSYKRHISKYHEKKTKRFICDICKSQYTTKGNLKYARLIFLVNAAEVKHLIFSAYYLEVIWSHTSLILVDIVSCARCVERCSPISKHSIFISYRSTATSGHTNAILATRVSNNLFVHTEFGRIERGV